MPSLARAQVPMVRLLLALAVPAIAQAQPGAQQPVVAESPAARSCLDEAQVAGTILLHDLQRNTWVAGRAERVDRALLPASTFKILSSMALLEAGVVATKKGVIPWDSVVRDRAETNRDLTLEEAFRLSSLAHFQVGVRRLPPGFLRRFLDDVGYGNRDMTGEPDRFWIDGGLRISPRQQVALLKRLFRNALPVSPRTTQVVKEMMAIEETPTYVLRAKTGLTTVPDPGSIGWWVGWVERGGRVTFFATVLESSAPPADFAARRLAVTRCALERTGALPAPAPR
jgi:beta-lactamase class D